ELIDALYHSNSGGRTENAADVWGEKTPYLVSVESPYDEESDENYYHSYTFEVEEVDRKLNTNLEEQISENMDEDGSLSSGENGLIEVLEQNESGSVSEIKIGDENYSGEDIRELLDLPSTKFEFSLENDQIIGEVRGYGHGVGMSQDGANGFAKHGYDYRQILKHYYQSIEIVELSEWDR
ncbi:MAG: SpoIID/LytB domain-containing protein, partial [Halanaerobiaceae bacterium]